MSFPTLDGTSEVELFLRSHRRRTTSSRVEKRISNITHKLGYTFRDNNLFESATKEHIFQPFVYGKHGSFSVRAGKTLQRAANMCNDYRDPLWGLDSY